MAGRSHLFVYRRKLMTVSPAATKKEPEVPAVPSGAHVLPGYNKLSESLRKKTPTAVICLAFCGGRKCRFDTNDRWATEDMAVDGLYSHWVTEDILAMSRPNAQIIQERDIVGQFVRSGIKTIINLQTRGEHSHCGPPLTSSGFSYLPENFMERDIYYYNFAWKDYEHGTLEGLLDAVKVLSFAVTQGKVAVHCHAGLGRTGVLLCCYLIYSQRIKSDEAIRQVRRKRPNAVQTSGQIMMIQEFGQFLLNCSNVFCVSLDIKKGDAKNSSNKQPFTLRHHLEDQKEILHGYEARALRYIPKIVYVICERLLFLCRVDPSPTLNFWMDESRPPFIRSFRCFVDEPKRLTYRTSYERRKWDTVEDLKVAGEETEPDICQIKSVGQMNICSIQLTNDGAQIPLAEVVEGLLANPPSDLLANPAVREYCVTLDGRQSAWENLSTERDPEILAALLWHWLIHLKTPLLKNEELSEIVVYASKPDICFSRFEQATRFTVEYLLRFVQRLSPCPTSCDIRQNLLCRLASVLTQQAVAIDGTSFPSDGRKRLGQGTLTELLKFFNCAIELYDTIKCPDDESINSSVSQE